MIAYANGFLVKIMQSIPYIFEFRNCLILVRSKGNDIWVTVMKNEYGFLAGICRDLGIELSSGQLDQFRRFADLLLEKNKVMNLTAITELHDVMIRHFYDSLTLVKAVDLSSAWQVIDVGTGAGFPGIPVKISFPALSVTLMDALSKRVHFLDEVIEACELDHIKTIHARAEDLARDDTCREKFDLAVSRAVANMSVLAEYTLPFVKTGGILCAYKSGNIEEELKGASRALQILGGNVESVCRFTLPEEAGERTLVTIRKTTTTPKTYPRKAGLPGRKPL